MIGKKFIEILITMTLGLGLLACQDVAPSAEESDPVAETSEAIITIEGLALSDIEQFTVQPNTWTVVPFVGVSGQLSNRWNNDTHSYYQPIAGTYLEFCASATSWTEAFELDLFVNGVRENAFAVSNYGTAQGCRTIVVNYNDTIDVRVYQQTGSAMTFSPNSFWNWMTISVRYQARSSVDDVEAFSMANGTFTKVPYTTVLYDAYNPRGFNVDEHRYYSKFSYYYRVCASLATFNQAFELDLFINGVRERAIAATRHGIAQGCRDLYMNSGDYLEIWAFQGSGAPVSVSPNNIWNWMTVDLLNHPIGISLGDIDSFTAPSGTFTMVPYTNVLINTSSVTKTGNTLTVNNFGNYRICGSLVSFAQDFEIDLFINGVREKAMAVSSLGAAHGCRVAGMWGGETIAVGVHQGTGVPMTFSPNSFWNWLQVSEDM